MQVGAQVNTRRAPGRSIPSPRGPSRSSPPASSSSLLSLLSPPLLSLLSLESESLDAAAADRSAAPAPCGARCSASKAASAPCRSWLLPAAPSAYQMKYRDRR